MIGKVTYESTIGPKRQYTLPIDHRNWTREPGCMDLILTRTAEIDLPLKLSMQIKTDGSVVLARTEWSVGSDNTYWHVSQGATKHQDGKDVDLPLTDAQEKTIAFLWSRNFDRIPSIDPLLPLELASGIGATPQRRMSRSVIDILEAEGLGVPPVA